MADNNPDIRILAGLQGGTSLDEGSGKIIKDQLNAIAEKYKFEVNIAVNKQSIDSFIKAIQDELDKTKFKISGGSSSNSAKTTSGGKSSNSQIATQIRAHASLETLLKRKTAARKQEISLTKDATKAERDYAEVQRKSANVTYQNIKRSVKLNAKDAAENIARQQQEEQNKLAAATAKYNAELSRTKANLDAVASKYSKMDKHPEFASEFARLNTELNNLESGDIAGLRKINTELTTLKKRMDIAGLGVANFGQKFTTALKKFWQYFNVSSIVLNFVNGIKRMWTNVVELDSAMTDLQIASGKNRTEIEEMIAAYHNLAQEVGATTVEVAQAADTWLRQGYDTAEATELIRASMMLSKLGQIESAEASQALTSAMKGYKVSVEDVVGVVDRLTAVDMVAAVSAGDIATAMSETAVSANIAGVSMDKLIGYLATVQEVTQDGAESVGNFAKTLFARMGNIKAGNLEDPESGETLSDVETVLGSYGISLRESNNEFRNFGQVLDEVAGNWDNYSTVAQRAIAVAFSGTRQQEKFLVLMENYDKAAELAAVSTGSLGTATEKYTVYMDSMEAKINALTAATMDMSDSFINSDFAKNGVEIITGIVNAVTKLIDTFGVLPTTLATVGGVLTAKNFGLTQNDGLYIWAIHSKEAA